MVLQTEVCNCAGERPGFASRGAIVSKTVRTPCASSGEAASHQRKREMSLEWMDLRALTQYAAVSERTAREWIRRAENPLPAVQVGRKIYVQRSVFDQWLNSHVFRPVSAVDLGRIVDEVMAGFGEPR